MAAPKVVGRRFSLSLLIQKRTTSIGLLGPIIAELAML
jgi:hypothetical protein